MCWPTVEAPQPSAQEQDVYDTILEEIEQQNQYSQETYRMQMEESHHKWVWDEGIDPDAVYEPDPALEAEKTDLLAQIEANNKRIAKLRQLSGQYKRIDDLKRKNRELNAKINEIDAQLSTAESEWEPPKEGDLDFGHWEKWTQEDWDYWYENEATQAERDAYDLDKASTERALAAERGELPLSEALQEQKQKEFEQLKQVYGITGDTLENASGEDTIAIQNLNEFKTRWAQIEEAQRYGKTSASVEEAILAKGLTTGQTQNRIGTYAMMNQNMGSSIPAYGSLLQPYQMYNMAGYQAGAQNQATAMQGWGSVLGLLGMLGGGAMGGLLRSSRKDKINIKRKTAKDEDEALKKIRKTKSYEYKYKPLLDPIGMTFLGGIAEESPSEITVDGKAISIPNKIELMNMAIKSIDRKVEKLVHK